MYKPLIISMVLMMLASPSIAEDADFIHARDCTSCHGTELYTRQNRTVEFLADLELRVERCNIATKAGWTDDQVDEVSEYLNENYYHFK